MDPINLLIIVNLIASISANWSGAKKGLKTSVTKVIERPHTYLQKLPPNISALILILIILGIFGIGNLSIKNDEKFQMIRIAGLIVFIIFSWLQVSAFKSLGNYYTQDIVILKEHKLIKSGLYKLIRHPQYLCQILSDLGAGIALFNYLIVPIVVLVELPLFVLRARYEEKLLEKYFKDEFINYKKQSGFFIPFIG
ncbi:MAG: isoprenylcysteine carboxylmethyltransferase family protein [Melioribacter sp.]|uniref:methyltransferase family protein n=1 Tax=Rosettibacter primus TaxID=3111523 RepID=UPI00247DB020|nr:isoprenylcysteine carboxylmethyltransferase family protein [Melioribacter sp.]